MESGDFLRAYELCLQAIKDSASSALLKEKCDFLRCFGNVCHSLGKHEEAEKYYQEAILLSEQIFKGTDLFLLTLYNDLGTLYSDREQSENALETFHRLEKLIKSNYGDDHPALSDCYNNIASTLIDLQKLKEAKKYIKEDEKIIIKLFGPSHVSLATTYTNMGCISQKMSQAKKALTYFKKAYEILRMNNIDKHSDATKVLLCLGNCNLDQGNYDQALEYFMNAQNILIKHGMVDQPIFNEINMSIASIYE